MITLGSPFNLAHPKTTSEVGEVSSSLLKIYERLNPNASQDELLQGTPVWEMPPPVPSTSIYSEGDGIAAWRSCVDQISDATENLRVTGSHTGMTHNPLVYYAVSERLSQADNQWQPFHHKHWVHRYLFLRASDGRAEQAATTI